jgi:hypothetical protein
MKRVQVSNLYTLLSCDTLLPMEEETKVTTISSRVEVELRDIAQQKAKLQGTTVSKVVRALLIGWVKGIIPDPPFGMELNDEQDEQG